MGARTRSFASCALATFLVVDVARGADAVERPLPEPLFTESVTDLDGEEGGEVEAELNASVMRARRGGATASSQSVEIEWLVTRKLGLRIEPFRSTVDSASALVTTYGANGAASWKLVRDTQRTFSSRQSSRRDCRGTPTAFCRPAIRRSPRRSIFDRGHGGSDGRCARESERRRGARRRTCHSVAAWRFSRAFYATNASALPASRSTRTAHEETRSLSRSTSSPTAHRSGSLSGWASRCRGVWARVTARRRTACWFGSSSCRRAKPTRGARLVTDARGRGVRRGGAGRRIGFVARTARSRACRSTTTGRPDPGVRSNRSYERASARRRRNLSPSASGKSRRPIGCARWGSYTSCGLHVAIFDPDAPGRGSRDSWPDDMQRASAAGNHRTDSVTRPIPR